MASVGDCCCVGFLASTTLEFGNEAYSRPTLKFPFQPIFDSDVYRASDNRFHQHYCVTLDRCSSSGYGVYSLFPRVPTKKIHSPGRRGPAFVSLAMASYLSLYPILLFLPLLMVTYDCSNAASKPSIQTFSIVTTVLFTSVLLIYLKLSHILTGSWEFIASTYGVSLLLPDLTPNVGLWWYFFIEMFDSFRAFFLCLFQLHLFIYVPGTCLRLQKQPLFALTTLVGIISIFKSYPAIGDTALYLSLLAVHNHIFPLMRYTFFLAAAILYATFLGPAFYYLWVYAGSGNANFFYAITLVWSIVNALIVADALYAVLRDEHETERPELIGKDVVQI
ncbi:hypothetical protein TWF694_010307 [Orbilia ellipsospora]|uniref:Uncharacterized protein n=1 Tax=Orbilia ellipsospora TaxID=2528407 RepID=A0AAV9X9G3_9PEZI